MVRLWAGGTRGLCSDCCWIQGRHGSLSTWGCWHYTCVCTPSLSGLPSPFSRLPSALPRFLRGDQYAVALGLLDEGQVVLGVLGCPNLPMAPITQGIAAAVQTGAPVGCVFSALKGDGTTAEALDGSQAKKVSTGHRRTPPLPPPAVRSLDV